MIRYNVVILIASILMRSLLITCDQSSNIRFDNANSQYPNIQQPNSRRNRNTYCKRRRLDSNNLSEPKNKMKKKRKLLSQNIPSREDWIIEDAEAAWSYREYIRDILSKSLSSIENGQCQQPSTAFVRSEETAEAEAVNNTLNTIREASESIVTELDSNNLLEPKNKMMKMIKLLSQFIPNRKDWIIEDAEAAWSYREFIKDVLSKSRSFIENVQCEQQSTSLVRAEETAEVEAIINTLNTIRETSEPVVTENMPVNLNIVKEEPESETESEDEEDSFGFNGVKQEVKVEDDEGGYSIVFDCNGVKKEVKVESVKEEFEYDDDDDDEEDDSWDNESKPVCA